MKSPGKSPPGTGATPSSKAPRKLSGIAALTAADPSKRGPGRGPAPGTGGRPRDEWKAWLRSLVDSPSVRAAIETVLSDPTHPAFGRVLQWADERGWGKEVTPLEATVNQLVVVRRDESGLIGAPVAVVEGREGVVTG